MKKTDQRIAIAEACGAKWHVVPPKGGYEYRPLRILSFFSWEFDSPMCAPLPFPDRAGDAVCVPEYLEDLNAMHKAERFLDDEELDAYCDQLGGSLQSCVSAPADSRAEAFLIVKGLWKD